MSGGARSAAARAATLLTLVAAALRASPHVTAKGWDRMGMGTDSTGARVWADPAASRLYECHSTGPGAVASPTRRQLADADARRYTVERVLDGWRPPRPAPRR